MEKEQQHIILVHGMCHGAWCWYKVATLLRSAGHRVTVPDLAASGIDSRRFQEDVSNFADYSQPLMDIMASLPPQEKVILVGHSLGGLNIALAMDTFPHKVSVAVFLTAIMPDSSYAPSSVLDQFQLDPSQPNSEWMDTEFIIDGGTELEGKRRRISMLLGPQYMASKLYQLCSPEDLTLARTLVRVGSVFQEDLKSTPAFSKDRYGSVPSVYIVCRQDAAVTEDFQRWMIQNISTAGKDIEVLEIEGADHMAMLSTPLELCHCLLHITDTHATLNN